MISDDIFLSDKILQVDPTNFYVLKLYNWFKNVSTQI
jgi:hypothetical protein